jgi:type IV pilus assembly protein PilA
MDPDHAYSTPGPISIKLPAFSAIVRIDGIGGAVANALAKNPKLVASKDGSLRLFSPSTPSPVAGLEPVLAVDGKTFFAATSVAFLDECLKRTAGLETNPEFATGLAALGPDGNGLTWISQRFFSRIRDIGSLNPQAPPQQKNAFDFVALHIPIVTQPLFSVRSNLPDGILVRSNWNRSLKSNIAMFTVYNPVSVGLMAAMAIPAFQKVRSNAQEKTVMNNLRMLDAAANDYYMINGVSSATYSQLVGPDKLVKSVEPVAGEDYTGLTFEKGRPSQIRLPSGKVIADPRGLVRLPVRPAVPEPNAEPNGQPRPDMVTPVPTPDSRAKAYDQLGVVNNLYALDEAAKKFYLLNKVDTVTYAELVGPDKLVSEVHPVAGEDYTQLVFKKGQRIEVRMADGRVIRYPLGNGPISTPQAAKPAAPQQAEAPANAQGASILENLQILNDAANKYYRDNDTTSTTFEQLVGPEKYIASIKSIEGEDYRSLLFKKGHPLRLYMKDGRVIVFPPPPPQPGQ